MFNDIFYFPIYYGLNAINKFSMEHPKVYVIHSDLVMINYDNYWWIQIYYSYILLILFYFLYFVTFNVFLLVYSSKSHRLQHILINKVFPHAFLIFAIVKYPIKTVWLHGLKEFFAWYLRGIGTKHADKGARTLASPWTLILFILRIRVIAIHGLNGFDGPFKQTGVKWLLGQAIQVITVAKMDYLLSCDRQHCLNHFQRCIIVIRFLSTTILLGSGHTLDHGVASTKWSGLPTTTKCITIQRLI